MCWNILQIYERWFRKETFIARFKLSEIEANLVIILRSFTFARTSKYFQFRCVSSKNSFVDHLVFHVGVTVVREESCGTCSYQTYISLNVRTANRTHADTCISRPSVVRFPRYLIPCGSRGLRVEGSQREVEKSGNPRGH